jgi:hypothetical protein
MANPAGESTGEILRLDFDRRLMLQFRGSGRCEACGELIGDGTDWRRAIYRHIRLASDPNVTDKEARSAANCMVLHPACHDDPVDFYRLHGFFPDNLRRK